MDHDKNSNIRGITILDTFICISISTTPPFHNVSFSSIAHIHIDLSNARKTLHYETEEVAINLWDKILSVHWLVRTTK